MKTKIAFAVVLGALFVAVPSATPKGKPAPASVGLTVGCSEDAPAGSDYCIITASGMAAGTYKLLVTDACQGIIFDSNESANFSATINPLDCGTGLTIQLFTIGKGGALTPVTVTITDNTGGVV
jgi:hypothetical protein